MCKKPSGQGAQTVRPEANVQCNHTDDNVSWAGPDGTPKNSHSTTKIHRAMFLAEAAIVSGWIIAAISVGATMCNMAAACPRADH